MASYINRATIMGNVGKDPEIRSFQNGDLVCNFSIATTENWNDKASGDRKERTQWHNIAIYNQPLIKIAEKHVRKGDKLYLEGQIEHQKYIDKTTGQERYSTQIVLRPYRGELVLIGGPQRDGAGHAGPPSRDTDTPRRPANQDLDDEIPF